MNSVDIDAEIPNISLKFSHLTQQIYIFGSERIPSKITRITRLLLGKLLGTRTSIFLILSMIPSNLVISNMKSYKKRRKKYGSIQRKITKLLGMVLELDYKRVFRLVTYLVIFSGFLLGVKKPSVCRDFSPSRKVTRFPRLRIQQLLDPVAPSIKSMSSRYFGNFINLFVINHAPQFTFVEGGDKK